MERNLMNELTERVNQELTHIQKPYSLDTYNKPMQYKNVIKVTTQELFYKHAFHCINKLHNHTYDLDPAEIILNIQRIGDVLKDLSSANPETAAMAYTDLFEVFHHDELLPDAPDAVAVLKWMEQDEEYLIIIEKDGVVLTTIKG